MVKKFLFLSGIAALSLTGLFAEDSSEAAQTHLIVTEEKTILPGALSCNACEEQCKRKKEDTKLSSCKGCKKRKVRKSLSCKDCG